MAGVDRGRQFSEDHGAGPEKTELLDAEGEAHERFSSQGAVAPSEGAGDMHGPAFDGCFAAFLIKTRERTSAVFYGGSVSMV